MRSVENEGCGKCGVWKVRSVENAGCGKCGVWKMCRKFQFSISISIFHFNFNLPFQFPEKCGETAQTLPTPITIPTPRILGEKTLFLTAVY